MERLICTKNRSFEEDKRGRQAEIKSIKDLKKCGRSKFRNFLEQSFCDENFVFWERCEKFKTLGNKKKILKEANYLYEQFIVKNAPNELNLCQKIREITELTLINPDNQAFAEAQDEIYKLMKNDSFMRFLQSMPPNQRHKIFVKPKMRCVACCIF